jgi:CubicO group peptidase (beta-lactamase class C family)
MEIGNVSAANGGVSMSISIRATLASALTESGLPGVVVGAFGPADEPCLVAAGRRGVDEPEPMTADAIFWIASMTKAVTSLVALQLVGEGRLGLDEPVGRWLPELAAPSVLEGFDAEGRPRLRAARGEVTLRRLLTHTSGLIYDFFSADMARWAETTGASFGGQSPPPGLPLLFDPGESWGYGYSTDFVGRLIEAVEGVELAQSFSDRVFGPLGLADTTFASSPSLQARLAPMHARTPEGRVISAPFGLPPPPTFLMGGGGLYSTAADYLKFLRALLVEPPLVPPDLMTLLLTSQHTDPRPGVMKTAMPQLSNDFDPPGPTGWSLGFLVDLEPGPHGRSAGSLSWAGICNCYYWLDPARRVGGVMLAQLLPFADPGALKLFGSFERAVYASL